MNDLWQKAPKYANYLAQDKDGEWWGYKEKPEPCEEIEGWALKSGCTKCSWVTTQDSNHMWETSLLEKHLHV